MRPAVQIGLTMLGTMASICNFSLDAAMINSLNIMGSFAAYFGLDETLSGLNVAIIYIGSVVAMPVTGIILDKWGRRNGLLIGAGIALFGAVLQAAAQNIAMLLVGRFFLGCSFIFTGAGGPSWLMEIAPPKRRGLITNGMLGSLPMTGTIGAIIFLYIWESDSEWAWRGGLMAELVGPIIALIVLPFTPESIRWLISKGREEEAFETLVKLRGLARDDPELLSEFNQINQTIRHELEAGKVNSWAPLIKPAPNFRRFLISVLTNIFWQTNGTNFMPYFFTIVMVKAGIVDGNLLLKLNIGISAWAAFANLMGIYLTSEWGRRAMFLFCTPILAACFAILAIMQYFVDRGEGNVGAYGRAAIAMCFLFQWASFASWMILNFSYPAEILKYTQRARGIVLSQAIGYMVGIMMTYTMPIAVANISWKYYVINACWNVPMIGVIWWLFPETKGKTLEEIDTLFEGSAADDWLVAPKGGEVELVDSADSGDKKSD